MWRSSVFWICLFIWHLLHFPLSEYQKKQDKTNASHGVIYVQTTRLLCRILVNSVVSNILTPPPITIHTYWYRELTVVIYCMLLFVGWVVVFNILFLFLFRYILYSRTLSAPVGVFKTKDIYIFKIWSQFDLLSNPITPPSFPWYLILKIIFLNHI